MPKEYVPVSEIKKLVSALELQSGLKTREGSEGVAAGLNYAIEKMKDLIEKSSRWGAGGMNTNFMMVSSFNGKIGNEKGDVSRIHDQIDMIQSELDELITAANEGDWTELRDGICDVLVTTYGLAHVSNIDADDDMKAVCKSNNSKFVKGKVEAEQEAERLTLEKGVPVEAVHRGDDMWALIARAEALYIPNGKLLKGSNYEPPVFKNQDFPEMPKPNNPDDAPRASSEKNKNHRPKPT